MIFFYRRWTCFGSLWLAVSVYFLTAICVPVVPSILSFHSKDYYFCLQYICFLSEITFILSLQTLSTFLKTHTHAQTSIHARMYAYTPPPRTLTLTHTRTEAPRRIICYKCHFIRGSCISRFTGLSTFARSSYEDRIFLVIPLDFHFRCFCEKNHVYISAGFMCKRDIEFAKISEK